MATLNNKSAKTFPKSEMRYFSGKFGDIFLVNLDRTQTELSVMYEGMRFTLVIFLGYPILNCWLFRKTTISFQFSANSN